MVGYYIAIGFTLVCWIITYFICLLGIRKNLHIVCFNTWYFGQKYERMPKDKIVEINSNEFGMLLTWVWATWLFSAVWTAVLCVLLYLTLMSN